MKDADHGDTAFTIISPLTVERVGGAPGHVYGRGATGYVMARRWCGEARERRRSIEQEGEVVSI